MRRERRWRQHREVERAMRFIPPASGEAAHSSGRTAIYRRPARSGEASGVASDTSGTQTVVICARVIFVPIDVTRRNLPEALLS